MKVTCEIDSKERTMTVKVDGVPLADVTDFSAYVDTYDDNKVRFHIHQSKMDNDSKTRETRILSSASEADSVACEDVPGLFEKVSPQQVREDVASFMTKKLHRK